MAIWNNAIITPKVRKRANLGLIASLDDLIGNDGFTQFEKHVAIITDWFNVGRETVTRWYGFQGKAQNRCIPKIAEGFSPRALFNDDTDIIDPFTGNPIPEKELIEVDELTGEILKVYPSMKDQLRYRVLMAAVLGKSEGVGNEPDEPDYGLWREPVWHGKKRTVSLQYEDARQLLEYVYSVVVGENAYSAGQEGAYMYRAWYHILGYYNIQTDLWTVDFYCNDRGRNGDIDPSTGLPSIEDSDSEETATNEDGLNLDELELTLF